MKRILLFLMFVGISFSQTYITVPDKSTGDQLSATEFNQVLNATKNGTYSIYTQGLRIYGNTYRIGYLNASGYFTWVSLGDDGTFLASNGTTSAPAFRFLMSSDIPDLSGIYEPHMTNSAGLASALNDETGTGVAVFSISPSLVTPNLGTPSALTLTNATGLPASEAELSEIGTATYDDLQDYVNTIQSAGKISGGDITDNGDGTAAVSAGTGFIKTSDSDVAENKFFNWSASLNVSLTDNSANYLYVSYNSGSPMVVSSTSIPSDHNTNILLGEVFRDGTDLHIVAAGQVISNLANKVFWKSIDTYGKFQRASGMLLSEKASRGFALTAGVIYAGLTKTSLGAFDTEGGDTFTYYYRDGVGGFTEVTGQTQIDNTHYDNGSGTLATTIDDKYVCHWVYEDIDGHVSVVYGTNDQNLTRVQQQTPPTDIPEVLKEVGGLVGRIIILKDATSFEIVESAYGTKFVPSAVGDHNDLANIQGGTADEYYHLTSAQHTIATQAASSSQSGYLTSTDWNTFNNKADAVADTLTWNWGVMDTVTTGVLPGWKVPFDITIIDVSAYTDANTTTFNLEERGETTPNTVGTDVMSSDLVADNNNQSTQTFSNSSISKDAWIVPTISATGDVSIFSITIRYTK